jgi:glutamine amidotransferase
MCELFAMSSRHPTDVRASLEAFARHGGLEGPHKDGWGLAYYADEDVRLVKDAEAASHSECLRFIHDHPFVLGAVTSHIRKATQGQLAMKNCQPFARELGGRMHVFAHNGDLDMARLRESMPPRRFHPVGDTDSEYALCALLDRFPVHAPLRERLGAVARFAGALRALGPANFLYTDGAALFIHGDRRISGPGLHVVQRRCAPEQRVVLAASVPLPGEPGWQALKGGALVVARGGDIVARIVSEPVQAAA